ncbi:MAG: MFS transporter, partial [Planctomycetota bacterium]
SIEIIEGSPFDDDIDGADVLIRADGNGGDDMIRLSGTDQAAYGDDGDDTLDLSEGFGGSAWGGDDDDTLIGSEHLDRLFGGLGNDVLYAGGGVAEVLTGGDGDDTMFGTPENDTLYGGRGADTYWGGGGLDMVWVGQQDRSEGMVIDLNGGLSSGGDAEGDSFNGIATLFGMTPIYGTEVGLSVGEIAALVAAIYTGGMVLQYPIGWISDRMDRRLLILIICAVGAAAAATAIFAGGAPWLLLVLAFIVGGVGNPLYSLLVAHTNDFLD